MTQPPLWEHEPAPEPDEPPARSRRRVPRCDDCHHRVWAEDSLRAGPDGRRRGDKCRRKAARLWRRQRLRLGRVRRMRPGRDQLSILDEINLENP